MNRHVRALTLLTTFFAGGCFSYETVRMEDVRPAAEVRVRVTPEARARVSDVVGYAARDVEGKVVRADAGALLLTVPGQTAVEGGSVRRFYQRIDISPAEVVEIEQRQLNKPKTYFTVGAAALAAAAIVVTQFTDIGKGSGEGTKGGPEHLVLPLVRLR